MNLPMQFYRHIIVVVSMFVQLISNKIAICSTLHARVFVTHLLIHVIQKSNQIFHLI